MLEGVDLSVYTVKTSSWADFIIARACYGTRKDGRFDQHYRNARLWGIPIAAYLYIVDPDLGHGSISEQIDALLEIAPDADGYAIDWEGNDHPTKPETRFAIARLQVARGKAGFYASDSVYFDAGQDWTWIAHYGTTVWPDDSHGRPADIWQYQGMPLDRNRFNGTVAELLATWKNTPTPTDTGDDVIFPLRYPGNGRYGVVSVAAGKTVYKIDGATPVVVGSDGSGGWGSSAIHDVTGGSAGFAYTSGASGAWLWVDADDATIDVPTADCTAQVEAAVAAEHEKNREAALAAVGEAIP